MGGQYVIRDFSDPIAFFFFFFLRLNQQHEISKIGKGAGLGTEKARISQYGSVAFEKVS